MAQSDFLLVVKPRLVIWAPARIDDPACKPRVRGGRVFLERQAPVLVRLGRDGVRDVGHRLVFLGPRGARREGRGGERENQREGQRGVLLLGLLRERGFISSLYHRPPGRDLFPLLAEP